MIRNSFLAMLVAAAAATSSVANAGTAWKFSSAMADADTVVIGIDQESFANTSRCELGAVVIGNDNGEMIRCSAMKPSHFSACYSIKEGDFLDLFYRGVNAGNKFNLAINNAIANAAARKRDAAFAAADVKN